MILGILLLALHWLLDDRQYFVALTSIPRSRLWFAVAELLFSFGCIRCLCRALEFLRNHRFCAWCNSDRRQREPDAPFSRAVHHHLRSNDTRPRCRAKFSIGPAISDCCSTERLSPRHPRLAGCICGHRVALMGLAARSAELLSQADRDDLVRRASMLGLVPTLLQIPAGLWLALQMPEESRQPLFGGDWLATGLLLASIVLALQLGISAQLRGVGRSRAKAGSTFDRYDTGAGSVNGRRGHVSKTL